MPWMCVMPWVLSNALDECDVMPWVLSNALDECGALGVK